MAVTQPDPSRTDTADPAPAPGPRRLPALGHVLLAVGVVGVLAVFMAWQTFPNYDTYYTLVWGQELADGSLPDYDVFRTPTPHPLATLVAWVMAPFGTASDRILVLVSLFGYLGFLVVIFWFTERLLGRVIAFLAVGVMLTRTDMQLLALRAMFDLPFYLLVFGAAVLELRRPRSGWPVLALLSLAGLLRPEAWLLAGVYWLWLAPATPRPQLIRLAALVVAAPLLWMASDLIVTGEPLYSLTSTREVSGEFGRNRGLGDAIRRIPEYSGANDRIVTVFVGGMGLGLAVWILRRRAALPLALGALGVVTFLMIAAAGLSVIPRYMTIPSLLLSLCVAVALGGWTVIREPRARAVAIGIAVVSVAIVGWRASYFLKDARKLASQAAFVEAQHQGLDALLDRPTAVAVVRSCGPLTVPTHSAIPVIRYETGLPKEAIEASIAQDRPPASGLQLVGRTFNFEPSAARSSSGSKAKTTSERPWSSRPAPGFKRVARAPRWTLNARCP